MQTKEDLEAFYADKDPWFYRQHPDDARRKGIVVALANLFGPYNKTLDLGCGEGFITEDLPGKLVHGIELSDVAAERLPKRVRRVAEPDGKYDLIVACGVLYPQYDHEQMVRWIEQAAKVGTVVITCNIQDWEVDGLPAGLQVANGTFPYREYTEAWRVYLWA